MTHAEIPRVSGLFSSFPRACWWPWSRRSWPGKWPGRPRSIFPSLFWRTLEGSPRSGTWATFPLQSCFRWSFGPWTCTRKLFGLTRTWFARAWTRVVRGTWHGAPYWRKPSYIFINCCSHETLLKLRTHDDTVNDSDQYFTAMKHVCFQSEIFAKRNPVTLLLSDE